MISILVVDDHPVIRSGVRNLLRNDAEMRIAGEARTGAETLQRVAERHYDLVLLDICLPDGNAIEIIGRVRHLSPGTRVVMFSNAPEETRRAMDAGASAFLTKDVPADELRSAIKSAIADGDVADGATAATPIRSYDSLSARELEILLKIISGVRPKEVALELGISAATVYTHLHRAKAKLEIVDVRGLMVYAVRSGLLDWAVR